MTKKTARLSEKTPRRADVTPVVTIRFEGEELLKVYFALEKEGKANERNPTAQLRKLLRDRYGLEG